MAAGTKSVLHPTGLVHGHGECRYLDESIPVLTQVLALEVVDRRDHELLAFQSSFRSIALGSGKIVAAAVASRCEA